MAIQAWPTPERIEMHIDRRRESPWDDSDVFGSVLEREEVLAHPLRDVALCQEGDKSRHNLPQAS
jgi:hypothetical protein